jgi:hypothetical protein
MKNIIKILLPILFALLLVGCSDPFSSAVTETYTFTNNSSYDLAISKTSYSSDFNAFTLHSGATKSINATDDYSTLIFYNFTNNEYVDCNEVGRTITFTDIPWATYEQYLSLADYNTLLDRLETKSNITQTTIDTELELLNVRQNYDYSYYDGGTSNCHSVDFELWSSETFGWVYYITVDIWIDDTGSLKRSMCSYYQG